MRLLVLSSAITIGLLYSSAAPALADYEARIVTGSTLPPVTITRCSIVGPGGAGNGWVSINLRLSFINRTRHQLLHLEVGFAAFDVDKFSIGSGGMQWDSNLRGPGGVPNSPIKAGASDTLQWRGYPFWLSEPANVLSHFTCWLNNATFTGGLGWTAGQPWHEQILPLARPPRRPRANSANKKGSTAAAGAGGDSIIYPSPISTPIVVAPTPTPPTPPANGRAGPSSGLRVDSASVEPSTTTFVVNLPNRSQLSYGGWQGQFDGVPFTVAVKIENTAGVALPTPLLVLVPPAGSSDALGSALSPISAQPFSNQISTLAPHTTSLIYYSVTAKWVSFRSFDVLDRLNGTPVGQSAQWVTSIEEMFGKLLAGTRAPITRTTASINKVLGLLGEGSTLPNLAGRAKFQADIVYQPRLVLPVSGTAYSVTYKTPLNPVTVSVQPQQADAFGLWYQNELENVAGPVSGTAAAVAGPVLSWLSQKIASGSCTSTFCMIENSGAGLTWATATLRGCNLIQPVLQDRPQC